jgi:hypothetical protein
VLEHALLGSFSLQYFGEFIEGVIFPHIIILDHEFLEKIISGVELVEWSLCLPPLEPLKWLSIQVQSNQGYHLIRWNLVYNKILFQMCQPSFHINAIKLLNINLGKNRHCISRGSVQPKKELKPGLDPEPREKPNAWTYFKILKISSICLGSCLRGWISPFKALILWMSEINILRKLLAFFWKTSLSSLRFGGNAIP